ncbi:MAG TPA: response regulator transcription factor [Noviherbaspirillum sp.]|nr:response regulator transcription factor [Noviherbaspirillum sp.]
MKIAVLEDDPMEAALIHQTMAGAGHHCNVFGAGAALIDRLGREAFDLLILDWNLPDMTGDEVIGWVRRHLPATVVVMFLTSRALEENVVAGLMAGADDYMTKPVRQAELAARVHALSRRGRHLSGEGTETGSAATSLETGVFKFDLVLKTASVRGRQVELKPKEFEIAVLLFQNAGQIVSREQIMESVWGRELVTTSRTIDTHLSQVRTKLQLNLDNGVRVSTIYTIGYRLDVVA